MGCGGDLKDWIEGIPTAISDGVVGASPLVKNATDVSNLFDGPWILITTGGRIDLVFRFKDENPIVGEIVGRLAIWRIGFGSCSWISDYRHNYASQHNSDVAVEVERTSWSGPAKTHDVVDHVLVPLLVEAKETIPATSLPLSTTLPKIGKKVRKSHVRGVRGASPSRVQPIRLCRK